MSQGTLVLTLDAGAVQPAAAAPTRRPQPCGAGDGSPPAAPPVATEPAPPQPVAPRAYGAGPDRGVGARRRSRRPDDSAHASPSVRRFARELGVDLSTVTGSGPKGRILREDVQAFVKTELTRFAGAAGCIGFNLPPLPQVDFAKFGPVQMQPMSRIRKLSGANLLRNWVNIPHVTQHDEADITELEAFRKSQADEAKKEGLRFTLLAFLIKAVVVALKQYPNFNASLSSDGESLILKQYFNIGVAVDTPLGLVVPVIAGSRQQRPARTGEGTRRR